MGKSGNGQRGVREAKQLSALAIKGLALRRASFTPGPCLRQRRPYFLSIPVSVLLKLLAASLAAGVSTALLRLEAE